MAKNELDLTVIQALLENTKEYNPLSKDEQAQCAKAIMERKKYNDGNVPCEIDQAATIAREKLIYSNVKLVISIMKNYSFSKNQTEDVFMYGLVGLGKAADKYDGTYAFSTYASFYAKGEILEHLRKETGFSKASLEMKKIISETIDELKELLGYTPSSEQISQVTGIEVSVIASLINAGSTNKSLNDSFDAEDDLTYEDIIPDEARTAEEKALVHSSYEAVIKELESIENEFEKTVLKNYYNLNDKKLSQKDMAEKYNMTRQTYQNREKDIVRKFREKLINNGVGDSIGFIFKFATTQNTNQFYQDNKFVDNYVSNRANNSIQLFDFVDSIFNSDLVGENEVKELTNAVMLASLKVITDISISMLVDFNKIYSALKTFDFTNEARTIVKKCCEDFINKYKEEIIYYRNME